jgi:hypothetical protein
MPLTAEALQKFRDAFLTEAHDGALSIIELLIDAGALPPYPSPGEADLTDPQQEARDALIDPVRDRFVAYLKTSGAIERYAVLAVENKAQHFAKTIRAIGEGVAHYLRTTDAHILDLIERVNPRIRDLAKAEIDAEFQGAWSNAVSGIEQRFFQAVGPQVSRAVAEVIGANLSLLMDDASESHVEQPPPAANVVSFPTEPVPRLYEPLAAALEPFAEDVRASLVRNIASNLRLIYTSAERSK